MNMIKRLSFMAGLMGTSAIAASAQAQDEDLPYCYVSQDDGAYNAIGEYDGVWAESRVTRDMNYTFAESDTLPNADDFDLSMEFSSRRKVETGEETEVLSFELVFSDKDYQYQPLVTTFYFDEEKLDTTVHDLIYTGDRHDLEITDPAILDGFNSARNIRMEFQIPGRWKARTETLAYLPSYHDVSLEMRDKMVSDEKAGRCTSEGSCYLTTAAVDTVGLTDDCWELRTLRRFRDNWLARQDGGAAMIAEYYATAPGIVERLRRRADGKAILERIYGKYILPCATLSALGLKRQAFDRYRRLVAEMASLAGKETAVAR